MVAVYLGDLWHTNGRLTAAGDTTAPSIALSKGSSRAVSRAGVWGQKWVEDLHNW